MWYYSSSQQFEELLNVLDSDEMEAPLVRELLEMKQEILRQMDITERLTNQVKGNRKSYLEIENANIVKQRKVKEEEKQHDHNPELKIEDDKLDNVSSLVNDGDVVNEVTVVSEDTTHEDNDESVENDDNNKKTKGNTVSRGKLPLQKKHEEGIVANINIIYFGIIIFN